ncbi:ARM repeat-containing protein [Rhodofomes roseus]|uniref:ARM repeat-containing protein n=1 Tax=Rhodofomes roseus TaxID=34475 RepID=A0ABQ8JYX7_9APHY|nr:ARM repeat-containing protein [Rhodofomes roseus]KAH9829472.1 ARM repeat-containing protein [Rhodofomes roseus]
MAGDLESGLDQLLTKREGKPWNALLPDELSCLINSFLPSQPTSLRPKAYIALSAICTKLRKGSPPAGGQQQEGDPGTEAIRKTFGPSVVSRLSDTTETEVLAGMSFLTALFEVDWQSAAAIFADDGVLESVTDALDLFSGSADVSRAVAALLANASGHKSCRSLFSEQHVEWLATQSQRTSDDILKASAAVALVKLSQGAGAEATQVESSEKLDVPASDEELARLMKGLVVDGQSSSFADAVEGLAYMSTNPKIKELLANDGPFLSRLFSLVPRRKAGTAGSQAPEDIARSPLYGVVVIIFNLCSYRPRLTDEQAQIAKLRRMANTPSKNGADEGSPLDDDEHVKARARKLVKQGALDALVAAVRAADSPAVRLTAGRTILHFVEDKENRGKILQAGGSKALMLIIQSILPTQKSTTQSSQAPHLEPAEIEPIQALAKLAITSAPVQVFGPNQGALFDAIRPLTLMLVHPASNLLQRFEALMALTNLASQGGEVADRVANADGLLNKVELLMLEDHTLVRRAATELICNLVGGGEEVYNKFGGEKTAASKSKLQVLVALCDVEDLQTRLAASGAVATLMTSPEACQSLLELQRERKRVLPVLGNLIDPSISTALEEADDDGERDSTTPDPGLVHRGVICIRNLFLSVRDSVARAELATEAERAGVVRALVGVVQASSTNPNAPALRPTAEALKWLLESGIQITV